MTPQRMVGRAVVAAAGIALLALTVHAADEVFKHKPPEGFRPIDKLLPLETGPLVSRAPLEFDLAEGTPLDQCPAGLWQGQVRFVGHAGGDVEYAGTFLRCFPFGQGEARYPDGSTYVGMVNSYASGDLTHIDASNTRMAVREGLGTFTRADGEVVDRAFKRGLTSDERDDPRVLAFSALVADLGQRAGAPAVPGATAAPVAKGGKPKKKSGGFLDQLNDAFKEATAAKLGIETEALKKGDVGGFVQQNSNATTGANAVTKLDKPSNDVGGSGCLAGTFQRRICGNSNMTAEVGFSGGQRGTGYFKDQDCAMVCPQGRRFDFQYMLNGDGTMRIDYTGGQICGVPTTPKGGTQAYSCNGGSLSFGNDYQRVR